MKKLRELLTHLRTTAEIFIHKCRNFVQKGFPLHCG